MSTPPPDPRAALLGDLKKDLARLTVEIQRLLAARWRLARLEFSLAASDIRKLAIGLACGIVLAVAGLAVLSVTLAEVLYGCFGWLRAAWLAVVCSVELLAAAAVAWLAWRRFRRDFAGLQESFEELQEDLVWLREWANPDGPSG